MTQPPDCGCGFLPAIPRAIKAVVTGETTALEELERRLGVCRDCSAYLRLTRQCMRCGCFVDLKARDPEGSCPAGRW